MTNTMTRSERLERWADVLEQAAPTVLQPFRDVEFLAPGVRAELRQANSPLEIAYRDPVLRREGLDGDRFGAGARFFGLSSYQAHRLLCGCHYLGKMQADEVARRIRAIAWRRRLRERLTAGNPLPAFARWLAGYFAPTAQQGG